MENKKEDINSDYFENFGKQEKNTAQNYKKIGINTYMHNNKNNKVFDKKKEKRNLATINEIKNRQKQIKKYLCNKSKKENINPLNNENSISNKEIKNNITEIELNKMNSTIKNIKVNKIKMEDIKKDNKNISFTKKDFYNKPLERNKSFNFYGGHIKYQQDRINNINNIYNNNTNNLLYFLNNNKKNQRKTNYISVRSFDKNKELGNDQLLYSDYFNSLNKDNSNFSFYQYNILNNNISSFNRNNSSSYTYSNFTTPGKNKMSKNTSRILISFKNIKTFYAHLEILISLYLKRNFNYFIERIKEYNKEKSGNKNLYENIKNKNGPIINVNNAHCSLFCSININPDNNNNNNSNNNKLFNTVFNSNDTPMSKNKEIEKEKEKENIKMPESNAINYMKKNRFFLNKEYDLNINKKSTKEINKSVYIPKNKITKFNNNIINEIKLKPIEIDNIKEMNNNINENNNNINNDLKQSSPIKEMNINLKKINVCRLNDLNQLYLNHNLYKNNSNNINNINFQEISNILNINNNNNTLHSKYNSNNIIQIDQKSNNISKDKIQENNSKLKKITSAKNGVYTRPKDNKSKKIIKEIKIHNKISPYKNEINSSININNNKKKNVKTENITTINNNLIKNKISNLLNSNLNNININNVNSLKSLNTSQEKNIIKKIYIRRNSKNNSNEILSPNKSDNNDKQKAEFKERCLTTLISFNKDQDNNFEQKDILIKQIKTSDKRIFISIKYVIFNDDYIIKNSKYNLTSLKIENKNSISIIKNKLIISQNIKKNNIAFKVTDIFSFDNDKKAKKDKIKNKLIIFIRKINYVITNNIRNNFFYEYRKKYLLKKIILNKYKNILNYYFNKMQKKKNKYKLKNEKKNNKIYHKINYNDDFNLNKRINSPNNIKQNKKKHSKTKAYNLSTQNSLHQNKIKNKRKELISSVNFNSKLKFINKEINIIVHNNNNNISTK